MIHIFLFALGIYFGNFSMEKPTPTTLRLPSISLHNLTFDQKANEFCESPHDSYGLEKIKPDRTWYLKAEKAAYQCDMNKLRNLVNSDNVNAVNAEGHPIIFKVISRGFNDLAAPIHEPIDFLIAVGANIDVFSYNQKMSALEYATRCAVVTHKTIKPLVLLLEFGADPLTKNQGRPASPFKFAFNKSLKSDASTSQAHTVVQLFRRYSQTLHKAVAAHDIEKVSILTSKKNSNALDCKFKTPLYYAITRYTGQNRNQMLPILQILLNNQADPNAVINDVASPPTSLMLAATIISLIEGDISMLPILVKAGGNPCERNADGPSAYDFAKFASTLTNQRILWLEDKQTPGATATYERIMERIQENQRLAMDLLHKLRDMQSFVHQ